jgi:MSHA biogenesis protein MshN
VHWYKTVDVARRAADVQNDEVPGVPLLVAVAPPRARVDAPVVEIGVIERGATPPAAPADPQASAAPSRAAASGMTVIESAPARTGNAMRAETAKPTESALAAKQDSASAAPASDPILAAEVPRSTAQAPVESTARRPDIEVRMSSAQERENDYRRAVNALNQGRPDDARVLFVRLLADSPAHDAARQALIGIHIHAKRLADAESLADERLQRAADHAGFALISSRLKYERGDFPAALETLRRAQAAAQTNADYQAFMAAVLQRLGRHAAAVDQYHAALKLNPNAGVWMMGLAMSLQEIARHAEAQDVFRRARTASGLSPELLAFIDQRLAQLNK